MPHKCTRCEQVFPSGDMRVLSGCPNCGWNQFLYVEEYTEGNAEETKAEAPSAPAPVMPKTPEGSQRVESVKIIDAGNYEVNLKKLLERQEIVLAMKEDGKYVIHLPSLFGKKREVLPATTHTAR